MIIDIVQKNSSIHPQFEFFDLNGLTLYTGKLNSSRMNLQIRNSSTSISDIQLLQQNKLILRLLNESFNRNFTTPYRSIQIENAEQEICGTIYYKRVNRFFNGYDYFEVHYNNKVYTCYEIGMGRKGIFICVYIDGEQIAMIEKETIVYDNKDTYKLFILDDNPTELFCILTIYYDHLKFSNFDKAVYKKKQVNFLYTFNKELKSKYNPDFKSLC